ncbi:MAG: type II toxin-antitoxin system VapC family toxin [Betaproteobacteria bacterium]|nr:type II toxin-antitoxin system VapC family toxin [Betaproteobacteria bacterium]
MILADANLLIYAVDRDSPHHASARRWLEETLSGAESLGIAWIVALAFVRITTHPGIMRKPLAVATALDYIDGWLRQPFVKFIAPGEMHWPVLRNLLAASGAAGNLTSDAHLAALAIEQGATIASADNDFRRFSGVTHVNPLALQA